jgi:hypothetical protein
LGGAAITLEGMQDSRPVCRFGLLHFLLAVAAFSAAGGLFRVSQQMQLAAPNFSALALFAAAALFGGAVASVSRNSLLGAALFLWVYLVLVVVA